MSSDPKRTYEIEPVVDGPNGFLGARVAVEWNRILIAMASGPQGISTEVVLSATAAMFISYISAIPDPEQREAYINDLTSAIRERTAVRGKANLS